ncbi:Outer membrane protein P1 precursor [Pseudovibrio axinellae]|uniref:Outer membrane protein P1 n=1 Tax=Pseudovibrio axinellae TaxID=989403 RepID=A0A166AUU7_9HYPH|nr:outer membrane protein transport protein [Pseudovibrio axinellae]KZL21578.1 Outer membrane protein P1 precursor [Pseudovibrio axinellae]SER10303.1 long-chain fatty acid transport protein [Pseudovibrio axinellae]
MRVLKVLTRTTVLGCAVSMIPAAALAGGWSTEGIADYGLMFEEGRFIVEGQATYGARNVDFENAETTIGGAPLSVFGVDIGSDSADDMAPDLFVGSGSVKIGLTDNIDFFARINEPYFISEQPGFDWNGRFAIAETNADSLGFDAMLSYKHEISKGNFIRVFGGPRALTVNYEQLSRTLYPTGIPALPYLELDAGIDVESDLEYGYRIGASFEKPEIALRAMIAYESAIDIDLDGDFAVSSSGVAVTGAPASASATLPQSLEAKIQSGVAPGWMVSLGVKWTDWSVLDKLSVNLEGSDVQIVRDLGYSDGWIVEAGVGHQLTEKLSVGSTVTWDKGIGGPYSDYYAFGLGGSYDLTDNLKFSLGGRAIYKTASEGVYDIARIDSSTGATTRTVTNYDYDSSWNFALSSKIRLSF